MHLSLILSLYPILTVTISETIHLLKSTLFVWLESITVSYWPKEGQWHTLVPNLHWHIYSPLITQKCWVGKKGQRRDLSSWSVFSESLYPWHPKGTCHLLERLQYDWVITSTYMHENTRAKHTISKLEAGRRERQPRYRVHRTIYTNFLVKSCCVSLFRSFPT